MNLYNYFKYGCALDFPKLEPIEKVEIDFEFAKRKLEMLIRRAVRQTVLENTDDAVFQVSGGLDSSVVYELCKNDIGRKKLYCIYDKESDDINYAKKYGDRYSRFEVIDYKGLMKTSELDSLLARTNLLNPRPMAHLNNIGIYKFLRDVVRHGYLVGGEGVELLFMGYDHMFRGVLENAVARGDYDSKLAQSFLGPDYSIKINFQDVMKYRKVKTKYIDCMDFGTCFTDAEIDMMGIEKKQDVPDYDLHDFLNFIYQWYGKEYIHDRCNVYLRERMEWLKPYTHKEFVDFCLSLPAEMRNCLGNSKHIFRESVTGIVPSEIRLRPKQGLNVPMSYWAFKKSSINQLVIDMMWRESKIFDVIDRSGLDKVVNKTDESNIDTYVRKMWRLLNLNSWLETYTT